MPNLTPNSASNEVTSFAGFEPLESNYVFCPNQFFDICLKSNSRGMVRSVAFVLRQTLGWLDSNGHPVNQTVKIPYSRLIKEAGVSERAIPKAIQLATASGFIECVVAPARDQKNSPGSAGEYTLNWDNSREFVKSFSDFNGFYIGEGHRSPIPNSYFDTVIPNESLSVTKVVGAVLRHTIGYATHFGGRRMTSPLSCTSLQKYTGINDRKTIIAALRRSIDVGYIERVQEGAFHPDRTVRTAAVYGVCWIAQKQISSTTAKTPPVADHSKNPTRATAETPPANHGKNPTSIEKTKPKDILKQQVVVDFDLAVQKLRQAGFDSKTARSLVEKRGVEVVNRQLDCIDARKPKNRLAMLCKAIEEDWDEPGLIQEKQKQQARRKHLAAVTQKLEQEDANSSERKQQRSLRKRRLLQEWGTATHEERTAWISAAAKRQTAESLRNIIRKESSETTSPCFQVLDELALERGLPAVTSPKPVEDKLETNSIFETGSSP